MMIHIQRMIPRMYYHLYITEKVLQKSPVNSTNVSQ